MYSVTVERKSADGQERQIWNFSTDIITNNHNHMHLHLWEYHDQYRRNTRCKWVSRLFFMKYGGDTRDKCRIPAERVPLPQDVVEEAKQIIFSQIKVTVQ